MTFNHKPDEQASLLKQIASVPLVCGDAKVVWLDREAGKNLCEHCKGRGLRKVAEESEVV